MNKDYEGYRKRAEAVDKILKNLTISDQLSDEKYKNKKFNKEKYNELLYKKIRYHIKSKNLDVIKHILENEEFLDINLLGSDGTTYLMAAAYYGNLEIVKLFVKYGININAIDKFGNTALMWAIESEDIDIIKFLIDIKLDLNLQGESGDRYTALMRASVKGNIEIVKLLIKAGVDTNKQDKEGYTALMWALFNNNEEMIKLLIKAGADVDKQDIYGNTALVWASYNNNEEIVKLLQKMGADINKQGHEGATPLMWASFNNNEEIVKLLIKAGADVTISNNIAQPNALCTKYINIIKLILSFKTINITHDIVSRALIYATTKAHFDIAIFLIKKGANVNICNSAQQPLISIASVFPNAKRLLKCLIQAGADVNARDKNGHTPLLNACAYHQLENIKCLIEEGGANIDYDTEDLSPLVLAIVNFKVINILAGKKESRKTQLATINYLIKKGARINPKTPQESPLKAAIFFEDEELIDILVKAGADVNYRDSNSSTILMNAISASRSENIIRKLVALGADINAKSKSGFTVLFYVILCDRNTNRFKLLLDLGADINAKDNEGMGLLEFIEVIKNSNPNIDKSQFVEIYKKYNKEQNISAKNKK